MEFQTLRRGAQQRLSEKQTPAPQPATLRCVEARRANAVRAMKEIRGADAAFCYDPAC